MRHALPVGVYTCCGQRAQRGPSHRPVPQSGCAYQPHTPLTPPEAPTYHLDPGSALCGARLADLEAPGMAPRQPSLVQILLRHQDLIVRQPGEIQQVQTSASKVQPAEEDRAQPSSEQQVIGYHLA